VLNLVSAKTNFTQDPTITAHPQLHQFINQVGDEGREFKN